MKQYLIEFQAEYYCQGTDTAWFTRLVEAESYEHACNKIKNSQNNDWYYQSPKNFKNATL